MKEIKNVSIIGMGALGVMYGSHLAHHAGVRNRIFFMGNDLHNKDHHL